MSSAVNMLRNSLKISDTTKADFFQLIFLKSDQKIWQKYRRPELCSVSDPITYSLSIGIRTPGSLGI